MTCSICEGVIEVTSYGWAEGHNAEPVNDGRCCGTCNDTQVIPARLEARGYSKTQAMEIGNALRETWEGVDKG